MNISPLNDGTSTAGESITLSCSATLSEFVTTPVLAVMEWTRDDESIVTSTDRVLLSESYALMSAVFLSTLTFSPLIVNDSGVYSCEAYFVPKEPSDYLDPGESESALYFLLVEGNFFAYISKYFCDIY